MEQRSTISNKPSSAAALPAAHGSVRLMRKATIAGLFCASALLLAACSAPIGPTSLGLNVPANLTLPELPGTLSLPVDQSNVPGSALDAYSAVARGALVCWVGANGPLKLTHIFHAEAMPPSAGGGAEIVLHQRDPSQPSPRGVRALRIAFADNGGGTARIEFQNMKLPQDLSDAMQKDALAWAAKGQSCEAQVVRPPTAAVPAVAEKVPAKKSKKRV